MKATSEATIPDDPQGYLDAFANEFESFVLPALLERLQAGVAAPSPHELARRMLAIAPAAVPVNKMAQQVGPEFYDTSGVAVVLAKPDERPISRQAIEQRRRRRSVLALQTSDKRWIYPTWQFIDHEVLARLPEVLACFGDHPAWSVGTWLTTPRDELDDLTAVEWLRQGRDHNVLLRLARQTVGRWAA